MRTVEEMYDQIKDLVKEAYVQGFVDGQQDNMAFDDGLDETIHETLNYIFTDRLREICEAERAPDEWECMINAYGELEGFMHTKCGHQSQSATHYCSNCGHKMAIAESEAAQAGEGDSDE